MSKEEIEAFGVKALDFSFSTNLFLCGAPPHDPASPVRAYRKALPKELYSFLAQVLSSERKCVEVYGYDPLLSKEEIKSLA